MSTVFFYNHFLIANLQRNGYAIGTIQFVVVNEGKLPNDACTYPLARRLALLCILDALKYVRRCKTEGVFQECYLEELNWLETTGADWMEIISGEIAAQNLLKICDGLWAE
jgi:hypothetical protein